MKFTTKASFPCTSPKKMNFCTNPVSAVQMARRKMAIPKKMCHGKYFPLADISAPGNQKEKNPSNHCKENHNYEKLENMLCVKVE